MLSGSRTERFIEKFLKAKYMQGVQPTEDELKSYLANLPFNPDSTQTNLKFRPFGYRERFNVADWNMMVDEVDDDIDYLFEEQVSQALRVMKILHRTDITYQSYDRELRGLERKIGDMLLTSENAGAVTFAIGEDFTTIDNIDLENTVGCQVDLNAGQVTLDPKKNAQNRLYLSHLLNEQSTAKYKVYNSDGELQVGPGVSNWVMQTNNRIVNVFDDSYTAWEAAVLAPHADNSVVLEFEIPLSENRGGLPVGINRLDITSAPSAAGQVLSVYHTIDFVNWTTIQGVPDSLSGTRPQSLRFPTIFARGLRLTLRTSTANDVNPQSGIGTFFLGLSNVAFYNDGYSASGTLRTKALAPSDLASFPSIRKVSLVADEVVNEGTNIRYYVARNPAPTGVDTAGDEVYPPIEWRPIANIGRPGSEGPQLVDFGGTRESPRESNRFYVASTPTGVTRIDGIDFYSVYQIDQDPDMVVFKSGRLFRGIKGWQQTAQKVTTDRFITNLLELDNVNLPFVLYEPHVDEHVRHSATGTVVTLNATNGVVPVTHRDPYPSLDPGVTLSPDKDHLYQVQHVRQIFGTGSIDYTGALNPGFWGLPSPPFGSPRDYGIFVANSGSMEQLRPRDIVSINGKLAKIRGMSAMDSFSFQWLDGSDVYSSKSNIVASYVERDVTSYVSDVGVDGNITLTGLTSYADDVFRMSYHSPIPDKAELRTSGSEASKAAENQQNPIRLEQGLNYSLQKDEKTFTALADINVGDTITVSFGYSLQTQRATNMYTAFFRVTNPTTLRMPLIEVTEAEEIRITVDGDYISLTGDPVADDPVDIHLKPGVYQIQVQSKPVYLTSVGDVDYGCALYKLVNAQDEAGNLVFQSNRYFSHQSAYLRPMQQVSLWSLQNDIGMNVRDYFAIDSTGNVVVNYNPALSYDAGRDVVYMPPAASGLAVLRTREDFELSYFYSIPENRADEAKQILVKVELERDDEEPGNTDITPVLKSMTLRYM